MSKLILFLLFLVVINAKANELPKLCYGQYDATMPAFEFKNDNRTIKASAYKVTIKLTPEKVYYNCGSLSFIGSYANVSQDKNDVSMLVTISNSLSINFDFNVSVNKKSRNMKVSGLKGMPDTEMVKRVITLKRKS